MRWIKSANDTLSCEQLGATITRCPDRFVVHIGGHVREHYSLTGARMLAERMHREIDEFDHWDERRLWTPRCFRYRGEKFAKMLGRRAVMASTIALVAGLAGLLIG